MYKDRKNKHKMFRRFRILILTWKIEIMRKRFKKQKLRIKDLFDKRAKEIEKWRKLHIDTRYN